MNEDEKKMIELMEHRAMICLPEDAVRIAVNCEVYHDGEIISVTSISWSIWLIFIAEFVNCRIGLSFFLLCFFC